MENIKLNDICDVRDGTHDSPQYVTEGFPLVTSKNIIDGKIDISNVNYISEEDYIAINKRSHVDDGDILMPMIGTIGRPVIVKKQFDFAIKNVALIKFHEDSKITPSYVRYVLDSNLFKRYVERENRGGTQKFIALGKIRNFEVPLISLDKQNEITSILDNISLTIKKRNEQLAQLDELIKSRFVELFGYPVSNNMEWDTKTMGDVAPAIQYKGDYGDEVWLLNLDMVEAHTGKVINYNIVEMSEVGNSTGTFDTSNVLYSKLRPYLNKVVIPDRIGYATSELVPLQPIKGILNREYLAYMLRSNEFVNMITEKVAGAKMPRVSMKDFRSFLVPLPPIELQSQFAVFVQQVDKLKVEVQKSLDETQVLFDSLMQEYFD